MGERAALPIPDFDHLPERPPPPDAGSARSSGSAPDTNQPPRRGRADQTPNRRIRAR